MRGSDIPRPRRGGACLRALFVERLGFQVSLPTLAPSLRLLGESQRFPVTLRGEALRPRFRSEV